MTPEAVIFIGIQGSGKSTFYQERFADTHTRINLDSLKSRPRERTLFQACLRERRSFVVDNTNVLFRERALYIPSAKAAGYRVVGYFFQSNLKDALRRNQQRQGKAVIPVKGVVGKYRALQMPRLSEGFDQLYIVNIDLEGNFIVREWEGALD